MTNKTIVQWVHYPVYQQLIYSQINRYMSDKSSKHLAGFRKNHNTEHVARYDWKFEK